VKILVVDDDAFVRKPLESILRREGFELATASDGNECLERIEQDPPDLVVLDVMMPGPDGFETCEAIKADPRSRSIPVILLSARWGDGDRERGRSLGAADFLSKPCSPTDLVRRVRELLFEGEVLCE
jgi:two-component system phosphate regulon response regulator PhoB